jgi:hypothetical protein
LNRGIDDYCFTVPGWPFWTPGRMSRKGPPFLTLVSRDRGHSACLPAVPAPAALMPRFDDAPRCGECDSDEQKQGNELTHCVFPSVTRRAGAPAVSASRVQIVARCLRSHPFWRSLGNVRTRCPAGTTSPERVGWRDGAGFRLRVGKVQRSRRSHRISGSDWGAKGTSAHGSDQGRVFPDHRIRVIPANVRMPRWFPRPTVFSGSPPTDKYPGDMRGDARNCLLPMA